MASRAELDHRQHDRYEHRREIRSQQRRTNGDDASRLLSPSNNTTPSFAGEVSGLERRDPDRPRLRRAYGVRTHRGESHRPRQRAANGHRATSLPPCPRASGRSRRSPLRPARSATPKAEARRRPSSSTPNRPSLTLNPPARAVEIHDAPRSAGPPAKRRPSKCRSTRARRRKAAPSRRSAARERIRMGLRRHWAKPRRRRVHGHRKAAERHPQSAGLELAGVVHDRHETPGRHDDRDPSPSSDRMPSFSGTASDHEPVTVDVYKGS